MKLPHHLAIAAVLSVAMLGAAPGVWAQAQAKSSFDSFRYQIVDLNPHDGIDAGVSFLESSVGAWARLLDENGAVLDSEQANSMGEPARIAIDTADVYLLGKADGRSATSLAYIENGAGQASTNSFLGFVLVPYTQLIFSIDAIASASDTPGTFPMR